MRELDYREAYKAAFQWLHFGLSGPYEPLVKEVLRLRQSVSNHERIDKEVQAEVFADPRCRL